MLYVVYYVVTINNGSLHEKIKLQRMKEKKAKKLAKTPKKLLSTLLKIFNLCITAGNWIRLGLTLMFLNVINLVGFEFQKLWVFEVICIS